MVRCVLLLAFLGVCQAAPRLRYTLTVEAGAVHVALAASDIPANAGIALPTHWGNAGNLGNAIRNLRQRGNTDLRYDLVQDWQGDLRESVRHRAHITGTYIEFGPPNGLLYPQLPPDQKVSVELDWRLPPHWSLATSFGAKSNAGRCIQRFDGPLHEFVNAMFAAGDFRLARHKVRGGEVVTAIRGQFAFEDTAFTTALLKLIRHERDFWRDHRFRYFLVTLAPFGRGQPGSGGGAFTNAFNLHTGPESTLTGGILSLVAHEIFHIWNPLRMGRIAMPQETTLWFSEGFTRYYSEWLLWQAGLQKPEDVLQAWNGRIREHAVSPGRLLSLSALLALPRDDPRRDQVAKRGFLIALWLDEQIRRQSGGKKSMDELLRELVRERHRHPEFSKQRLFTAIGRYVDAHTAAQAQHWLESGEPVPAPEKLRLNCAALQMVEMHAFELGMDRMALAEKQRVVNLQPGSAAARAGLREGDVIVGRSIYWDDTSRPVKLTVRGGKQVEYLPRGESLGMVPQYRCP